MPATEKKPPQDLVVMSIEFAKAYAIESVFRHQRGGQVLPRVWASFGGDMREISADLRRGYAEFYKDSPEAPPYEESDQWAVGCLSALNLAEQMEFAALMQAKVVPSGPGDEAKTIAVNCTLARKRSTKSGQSPSPDDFRSLSLSFTVDGTTQVSVENLPSATARDLFGDMEALTRAGSSGPGSEGVARWAAALRPVVDQIIGIHGGGGTFQRALFKRRENKKRLMQRGMAAAAEVLLVYGDVAFDFRSILDGVYGRVWRSNRSRWKGTAHMEKDVFFNVAATFISEVARKRPPDAAAVILPVVDDGPAWQASDDPARARDAVVIGVDSDDRLVYLSAVRADDDNSLPFVPPELDALFRAPLPEYRTDWGAIVIDAVVEDACRYIDDLQGFASGGAALNLTVIDPLEIVRTIH